MEFLTKNQLETTSSITYNSGSVTAKYLLTRDLTFQYVTSGLNNDATTASLVFDFGQTIPVSRLALMGTNLKSFTLFYDGVTANTFGLTSTCATTVSDFISNSDTSLFFRANTVSCRTITLDMKSTIQANSEKAIGYFLATDLLLDFPQDPSSKNYEPKIIPKQIVHKLSDGGSRIQTVKKKFVADIELEYISTSFRDDLKTVYDLEDEFVFVAFGTTTGWDGILYPVVWPGNFEFFSYSDNAAVAGFSGEIKLLEVPE